MSRTFLRSCCTRCRKKIELDVRSLGRLVKCPACEMEILAIDAESQSASVDDPIQYWLRFTKPLETAEEVGLGPSVDPFIPFDNELLIGQAQRTKSLPR